MDLAGIEGVRIDISPTKFLQVGFLVIRLTCMDPVRIDLVKLTCILQVVHG